MTKRANTRAAIKPAFLGAPEAPPAAARPRTGDPRPKRAQSNSILRRPRMVRKALGRHALACVCGGEERRLGVGARIRALRGLTCGSCLNAVSAASEVSSAARPQAEYRSAPCAAGRRSRMSAHAGPGPRAIKCTHSARTARVCTLDSALQFAAEPGTDGAVGLCPAAGGAPLGRSGAAASGVAYFTRRPCPSSGRRRPACRRARCATRR